MGNLVDTGKAVARHLVAADKHGLGLMGAPVVKSLVFKCVVFVIYIRVTIRYVAIYYAAFWDSHIGIVLNTRSEILPPPEL